jgi:hypothetical protein
MRKTTSKPEAQIVMVVDQNARLLDLRVFSAPNRNVEPEVVGTATLRLQDLRNVVAMLSKRLQFQDQLDAAQAAARSGRKKKRAIA